MVLAVEAVVVATAVEAVAVDAVMVAAVAATVAVVETVADDVLTAITNPRPIIGLG